MNIRLPDLHRAAKIPEWETITPDERNPWQNRAAGTNGIDTPGNRETLKGVVSSTIGIYCVDKGATATGTALIGWGRWKDIRDGQRADATGTKGPKGEIFDAVSDSALLAYALPVMQRRGVISKAEEAGIAALTVAKFIASGSAKITGRELHAERINKLSMLFMWGGIGTHLLGKVAEKHQAPRTGEVVDKLGSIITYTGIGLGILGMAGYIKQSFGSKK